jgi:hypothetical protein
VLPHVFLVHRPHGGDVRQDAAWKETNGERPAVYGKILAHMRAVYDKSRPRAGGHALRHAGGRYEWWPPLPDEKWFPKLFQDTDQAHPRVSHPRLPQPHPIRRSNWRSSESSSGRCGTFSPGR